MGNNINLDCEQLFLKQSKLYQVEKIAPIRSGLEPTIIWLLAECSCRVFLSLSYDNVILSIHGLRKWLWWYGYDILFVKVNTRNSNRARSKATISTYSAIYTIHFNDMSEKFMLTLIARCTWHNVPETDKISTFWFNFSFDLSNMAYLYCVLLNC